MGLGYIGLPVALAFARQFRVIGFDIDPGRVAMLRQSEDPSRECPADAFAGADIVFTADAQDVETGPFLYRCGANAGR